MAARAIVLTASTAPAAACWRSICVDLIDERLVVSPSHVNDDCCNTQRVISKFTSSSSCSTQSNIIAQCALQGKLVVVVDAAVDCYRGVALAVVEGCCSWLWFLTRLHQCWLGVTFMPAHQHQRPHQAPSKHAVDIDEVYDRPAISRPQWHVA